MATSTAQDHKTKTLPLPRHEAPRDAPRDEPFTRVVLDGEIVEEEGPFGAAPDAPPRNSRRSAQRSAQRDRDRRQHQRGNSSSAPPADPMARLRLDVNAAGLRYMESLRRSDILAAKKTPKERTSQLSGIHQGYVSMMILSCIRPLSEEMNAKSVLNTVGMGAALWFLSPNFRTQVGHFAGQMKDTIATKIEERRESQIEKVIATTGKKKAEGVPLSQKWQDRLDRAERAQRGGRDAYTVQSAGMTEVALAENAYAAMRMPGADIDAIQDAYSSMLTSLYEQAHEDGVDAGEIATAARVVVGLRLEDEPELASVFGELSHGQFTKSDPREVRISNTGETGYVWTGEFESRLGQQVESGSFGLRAPMDADQHQAAIADTMAADMISLTRQHGVDGLNMGVVGYAAAWGLNDRDNAEDLRAMDNPLGERLRASHLMVVTMNHDGIDDAEQQRIYSNAYVDAMEYVGAHYPDVEQQWAEKFGANWRGNMRDFVSNPESYMDARPGEPEPFGGASAWEAGPAKPSAKYRNARINQNYIETASTGLSGFGSDASNHRDQGFEMGG